MTSAPSGIPTMTPSAFPSSNIPTSAPTITGAVVFVDMQKSVTSTLTDDEIAEIVTLAENEFGVFPGNVEADISYEITGSVDLTFDGDYDEEEVISTLQQSIASALNVHESDVEVTIDPDSGVATYTVSSATVEDALTLQDLLQETDTNDVISNAVSEVIPEVSSVTFASLFEKNFTETDLLLEMENKSC